MDQKDNYTKVFLKAANQPFDTPDIKDKRTLWWYNIRDVGGLRLTDEAKMYIEQADMDIVIARPFFLIGPRKIDDVCSSLGRGIVDIESGDKKKLEVGNLKIVRDFLDIRDGAKALSIISEKGISGESYNISSGKGFAIRNILDIFKEGSESRVIEIINPKIIRSIDDPFRIGNPLKLRSLGWKPEYKIEQSVSDILEYWRNK